MDIRKIDVPEGADIIMCSPYGGDNYNFIYENGNVNLVSNQNYCVDVSRNLSYKKNNIILWVCNGGYNQKFTIKDGAIRPRDRVNECIAVKLEGFLNLNNAYLFRIKRKCQGAV
ncbi:TPA: RICIN domain-containing protein [Escherichia coli]